MYEYKMLDKIKAAEEVYTSYSKGLVVPIYGTKLLKLSTFHIDLDCFKDSRGDSIPILSIILFNVHYNTVKPIRILTLDQAKKLILIFCGEKKLNDFLYKVHNNGIHNQNDYYGTMELCNTSYR